MTTGNSPYNLWPGLPKLAATRPERECIIHWAAYGMNFHTLTWPSSPAVANTFCAPVLGHQTTVFTSKTP